LLDFPTSFGPRIYFSKFSSQRLSIREDQYQSSTIFAKMKKKHVTPPKHAKLSKNADLTKK